MISLSVSSTHIDRICVLHTHSARGKPLDSTIARYVMSNSSQFFRCSVYSSSLGTSKKLGASHKNDEVRANYFQVVDEAFRVENACPHVALPQKPVLLFGMNGDDLKSYLTSLQKEGRDKIGRAIRKDAHLLMAGVASFPKSGFLNDRANFDKWCELTIQFCKAKYGSNLKSIVLHLDEEHPHLHFFCAPNFLANNRIEHIRVIHDGIRASDESMSDSAKVKKHRYDEAMRALQDDYYDAVAKRVGMSRIGPRTLGLTRKAWLNKQEEAKRVAQALAVTEAAASIEQAIAEKNTEIARKASDLVVREDLAKRRETIIDTKLNELKQLFQRWKMSLNDKTQNLIADLESQISKLRHQYAISESKNTILEDAVEQWAEKYRELEQHIKNVKIVDVLKRLEIFKAQAVKDKATFLKILGFVQVKEFEKIEHEVLKSLNKTHDKDL